MDVLGLKGFNKSDGNRYLIAAYGNDLVNVDTNLGFSLNLSVSNKVEFEVFLDSLFFQNYSHVPMTFDGSKWTTTHVAKTPLSKYLKSYEARMYLGFVNFNGTEYSSRVCYSDLPKADTITWGMDWGSDGVTWADNNKFSSGLGGFSTYNIKVGDPLFLKSGSNLGEYKVSEVINDHLLTIEGTFKSNATGQSFWVGGNWFDVRTDDNDFLTGLGENSGQLLAFKRNSLHRYTTSSLTRVKGVPGTTSHRSIINHKDFTFYFHGSSGDLTGIYAYDGSTSAKVSDAIQPYIDGMDQSNFPLVVSWVEGNTIRFFIGNLSNSNENISVTNAVASYNIDAKAWSIDPIGDVIRCATTFRDPEEVKILLGNSNGEILETPSGFNFNGDPIPWVAETNPIYPRGAHFMNIFTKLSVIGRDANGVNVSYKLWNTPYKVDDKWTPLGDLEYDRTDFIMPYRHNNASGISFRFEEISSREPSPRIESIILYSYSQRAVTPEIRQVI